jgi:hypothetical protein
VCIPQLLAGRQGIYVQYVLVFHQISLPAAGPLCGCALAVVVTIPAPFGNIQHLTNTENLGPAAGEEVRQGAKVQLASAYAWADTPSSSVVWLRYQEPCVPGLGV